MDAKTRLEMRRLAEAFSVKTHETGMVVRPVVFLLDTSIDHLKQGHDFVKHALKDLAKVEAGLPSKDTRAVQTALEDALKTVQSAMQRVEESKTPLKRIIAALDLELRTK